MDMVMSASIKHFDTELRLSYRYFLPVLAYTGIVFAFAAESISDPMRRLMFQGIGVGIYAALAAVWILDRFHRHAGAMVTLILLCGVITVSYNWTHDVAILMFMLLVPMFAAAVLNLRASLITGVALSAIILWLMRSGMAATTGFIVLSGVWGSIAVMFAIYERIYRLSSWFSAYYQQTINLLEDSREQRATLKQILADLERTNLNLTRTNQLAQGLRQVAEAARTAKTEFVANVSHELRTPLNMITGFSEMLLQSPDVYGAQLPPALLADLSVIYRNATHLSKLIDDVLDLSQMEVDQIALTKEYINIETLIESAVQAVHPLYASKKLYLHTHIEPNLPLVFCDQTRIREVLLNLLSNAGRFMDAGGAVIRTWQEGQQLHIAVGDTGPGIAPEKMEQLFQPFQQLDSSIRRRYGGTGLGLSISKRFIELHNGKIWVESQPDNGTTFFFSLPIIPLIVPTTDTNWRVMLPDWEFIGRSQPSLAPKPNLRPRIVIWDNENVLHRLFVRYWSDAEIVPVNSSSAAINELAREPALAFIMNETITIDPILRQQLAQSINHNIPFFLCAVPGVSQLSAELGIADRLIKPIARTELLDSLSHLQLERGTVLIVDDEPDALQLFSRMLSFPDRRYRILIARNGIEAQHILQEQTIDVLLLDLVMPQMNGFELLQYIHNESRWQALPIILISARDPSGQPIVSRDLSVTLNSGLSVAQLLAGIRALCKILMPAGQANDAPPPETAADSQASE
jgi:signal transduction histidine kinase/CheY-like chemotaxis protein